jgi:heme-binding NEAT domain protein
MNKIISFPNILSKKQIKPTTPKKQSVGQNPSTTKQFKVADMTTVHDLVAEMERRAHIEENKKIRMQNRKQRKNQARIKIKQQ